MSDVTPIPPQYGSLTTYLVLEGCDRAIAFYEKAFGAVELSRLPMPDGTVGHAELKIGDSILMLAEAGEHWPKTSAMIVLYVEDCDDVFARAVAAGAEVVEAVSDKFYGDRAGSLRDPFGQRWSVMTHKEDVGLEEMKSRMEKGLAS